MNAKTGLAVAGLAVAGGLMLTACGSLTSGQASSNQSATNTQPAGNSAGNSTGNSGGSSGSGSGGSGDTGNTGGGANSGQSSGTHKCTAADVTGSIGQIVVGTSHSDPTNPKAYPAYTYIDVTNTSGNACTIDGFGGLDMYTGGDGRPFHVKLERTDDPQPSQFTIAPGEHAYKQLQWNTTNNDNDSSAQDVGVSFADVILPDDGRSFSAWPANRDKGLPNIVDNTVDGYAWSKNKPNMNAIPTN